MTGRIGVSHVREIVHENGGREGDLWHIVTNEGFGGRISEAVYIELAKYGARVLRKWIRTQRIFHEVRKIGRPVAGFGTYRATPEEIQSLIDETVTEAVRQFRKSALAGIGWRPGSGTCMATYFVRACVHAFSNAFRKCLNEIVTVEVPVGAIPAAAETAVDIADGMSLQQLTDSYGITGVAATIVQMYLSGYSYKEIAERVGLSPKAVENRLAALRQRFRKRGDS